MSRDVEGLVLAIDEPGQGLLEPHAGELGLVVRHDGVVAADGCEHAILWGEPSADGLDVERYRRSASEQF